MNTTIKIKILFIFSSVNCTYRIINEIVNHKFVSTEQVLIARFFKFNFTSCLVMNNAYLT